MSKQRKTYWGIKALLALLTIVALAQLKTAKSDARPFFPPIPFPGADSTDSHGEDSLRFPLHDGKTGYPENSESPSSMDFNPPANYHQEVHYNPEDSSYDIIQKAGDQTIRPPVSMDAGDYYEYRARQAENEYFRQRLAALSMFNQEAKLPTLSKKSIFDRLFGGNTISVKPQGNLDLTFGGSWQNMKNPNMIQSAQKYGIFDFDMNMNVNLVAQIGTKLKLNISQNTKPTFGQQNMQKIEYAGGDDDIIRKVEAGNVSFPLKSSLLTGPLSLFGLKTQLQFGKLMVTGVISQQKSQRKSITVQGGAQTQDFEIKIDNYDENRNFFLGQYFRSHYEKALENLPVINSQVTIQKVEVWVTNRTGATQGVRDVLSFMDLGEKTPYRATLTDAGSRDLPDNRANRLYQMLSQTPDARRQSTATQAALGLGLQDGMDFQRSTMRQLQPSEFSFQSQLGYISLNTQVNADDILAVAYRYTYNGKTYQVGEFAEDLPPDSANQKVIFLKLLKGTSPRPTLPIWKLMMKNVYTISNSYGNLSSQDFRLNVVFESPSGGEKRYLPEGPQAGVPIISLLHLDRLNSQNDPSPDGVFDFVDGITVNAQQGKIIFPVLEPFGSALKPALGNDPKLEKRYLFQMLYDSTKSIADQFQQNNRFVIKGSYKGTSGSEISLGGFNIPQGSVSVTAGGQRLAEGVDYSVDYSRGAVTILNQGVLNSGIPINISFEDNATFGMVSQSFWGLRFDYYANEHLTLGGTIMRLTERPFFEIVQAGDEPIKNTVIGIDANYQNEFPALTRALDKLPFYSTTAPSLLSLSGEIAGIFPGHQKLINATDPDGSVAIDDFEGSSNSIDLRFPVTSWSLASTPTDATDQNGQTLFPEAKNPDLSNGYNRARLAWYMLDPNLVGGYAGTPSNIKSDTAQQDYWRLVQQQEIFSQKDLPSVQSTLSTFDLGYYPYERGPYNFVENGVSTDGKLENPDTRWGGIQRAIDNNSSDFESSNVEYVSFWVLDPYIYDKSPQAGGFLYLNLGNVSEDVLKDGRLSFENGIPYPKDLAKLDKTSWGYVPNFQQQITRSFSNDPDARKVQDVGYDELDDNEERDFYKDFLTAMQSRLSPASFNRLQEDPASDNYHFYRGDDYDEQKISALRRYKYFNNPQGNSPVSDLNTKYTTSGSALPESEDINNDNTLNETEAYYQYRIDLRPQQMQVGRNFITDVKKTNVKLPSGRYQTETWYHFKVPINDYDKAVGGIGDFRSIRFIRMFLTGFQDSVTLRFAQLQFDRNQWRRYLFSLISPGENIPEDQQKQTNFSLTSVGLEENYDRSPVPYRIPPGINRQTAPGGLTGQTLQQDEQSMSLQICGLKDGDARAVFKQQTLDMRQYTHLKMFIHAESVTDQPPLQDGDVSAFIRIGSDFTNNYYEYQVPLKITPPNTSDANQIWPEANQMDVYFDQLVAAKNRRNSQGFPSYLPYQTTDDKGNTIIIIGNPSIGNVRNIMLGVLNPKKTLNNPSDDGMSKCMEVWFDDLRMAGPKETPAYAASGQADIQLADLGNVHLGGTMHTVGYGNIDQKIDERSQDNFYTYDASTNLNLGRLMPSKWGMQLPVYAAYSEVVSNPKYNPYDNDEILSEQIKSLSPYQQDSLLKAAQDFTSITSFNVTNMRYQGNAEKNKIAMPWSLRNFDLSYSFNRTYKHTPLIDHDELTEQRLNLGYTYSIKGKSVMPFRRSKMKSKWLRFVKDFNFNYLPSSITFRNELYRIFDETQVRNLDDGNYDLPPTYFKNFTWQRTYSLRWELTRSLSFNYTGENQSRIDEPYGRIDSKAKQDSLWNNLSRFGRNTYFTQSLNLTYNLPTTKFPFLDWTNVNLTYSSTYNWTGASLLARDLGNVIANTQTRQVNANFNFTQLYNKWRWLRAINTPKPDNDNGNDSRKSTTFKGMDIKGNLTKNKPQQDGIVPKQEEHKQALPPRPKKKKVKRSDIPNADSLSPKALNIAFHALKKKNRKAFRKEIRAWRQQRSRILPDVSDGLRVSGRLATMLKRVNVNYSDNSGTVLPGFMDSTRFFGVNDRSSNGWYGFAFGLQPDEAWINQQAALNRITRDSIFNGQIHQTFAQNYNITATLEPFPDFRIDLKWNKQFSKDYTETFKYDDSANAFRHFSPYSLGTFNVSFVGLKTIFSPAHANEASALYKQFLRNREVISQRLGDANPYTAGLPDPSDPDYAKGYTQYAQQVLIPAFIAAYSGRNAGDMPLMTDASNDIRSNPFKGFRPMPNWSITYNGLSKLPAFRDVITNFSLTNNYSGTLSMNSFISSLYYQDILGMGFPSFIDSNSNNYVPFFQVPNVTISESLNPLIGIDIAFTSGLSLSLHFNKTRTLSLSLVDYQVSENKSTEFILGAGDRVHGMVLPFSVFGVNRLKNDINFRLDVGFRNDIQTNSYLMDNTVLPTNGQKVITISPTIDYTINDNLQLQLYYDRRQSIPAMSNAYPITTTRAGVTIRFLFAQ
ncbi:MAG TPA: cell surface protein SprA [Edaphocola sp.]|nr:cell surface protein SprA [Edaphocola sp.]